MVSCICNGKTSGRTNSLSNGRHIRIVSTRFPWNQHELITVSSYTPPVTVFIKLTAFHSLNSSEFRCKCGNCKTDLLSNALEFRCCKEVATAIAKLTFEGIERNCILDHTDFDALTNATVLEQVCPLLKDKKGRSYKFPTRGTRNAKNE